MNKAAALLIKMCGAAKTPQVVNRYQAAVESAFNSARRVDSNAIIPLFKHNLDGGASVALQAGEFKLIFGKGKSSKITLLNSIDKAVALISLWKLRDILLPLSTAQKVVSSDRQAQRPLRFFPADCRRCWTGLN